MRIEDMCLLELILYSSNWFVFLINFNPVFTYIHTQTISLLFLNNLWVRKSFVGCGRAYVIGLNNVGQPVHTTRSSISTVRPTSTLIRYENRAFRKRSSTWRNLKNAGFSENILKKIINVNSLSMFFENDP